jgi:hypothetical protein
MTFDEFLKMIATEPGLTAERDVGLREAQRPGVLALHGREHLHGRDRAGARAARRTGDHELTTPGVDRDTLVQ